jgi:hypothetical protein
MTVYSTAVSPLFFTIVQTETVNTGVDMPGKPYSTIIFDIQTDPIFGAWDVERDQERAVILRESWEYNARLRKNPGYTQAVEHIGYILGGYDLYTFNMVQATSPDAPDVAVIQDFERRLEKTSEKRAPSGTPTSRPVRT